jgi:secondary thiamine-phosphate synthase enzyme
MVYREEFQVTSNAGIPTFHNVTELAAGAVKDSGIRNGIVVVYSRHTTCCVIIDEVAFDRSMTGLETLQQDFVEALEKIMPTFRTEGMYQHPGPKALQFGLEHGEDARACHNTDAHLRSALVGRSETILVIDGKLDLGEFGNIYFIDFDQTRARTRTVQIQVMGE